MGWHFSAFAFGAFNSFFMRENVGWMIKINYLDEREWMFKREIETKINKGTDVVSKVSIFVLSSPQRLVRYSKSFNNRYCSELGFQDVLFHEL